VGVVAWPASAAAQPVPTCPPERTLAVKLTSEERGEAAALVATHDVSVAAEFTGTTVDETYTPPAGAKVLAVQRSGLHFVVPNAASVPITVSWRQAIDPSDPSSDPSDPAQSCAGSTVVTLPIVAARPSPAVKLRLWSTAARHGISDFAIVPSLERPDLSLLEISARTWRIVVGLRSNTSAMSRGLAQLPLRSVDPHDYPA
jgi:hypothetical protein